MAGIQLMSRRADNAMAEDPSCKKLYASDFAITAALSSIRSDFGKLEFLAMTIAMLSETNLRDRNPLTELGRRTALYNHINRQHQASFLNCLCRDLSSQLADLAEFFANREEDRNTLIGQWLNGRLYENLVPSTVTDEERRLFTCDISTVLRLLLDGQSVSDPSGTKKREKPE
jgi:hypothetical protein